MENESMGVTVKVLNAWKNCENVASTVPYCLLVLV